MAEKKTRTWADIYKELSEPMEPDAVQFADKNKTGKGYDMTGINYQYVINRLNDVVGPQGWSTKEEITWQEGGRGYESICILSLTIVGPDGEAVEKGPVYGHHSNTTPDDAIKGSQTRALKRAAAYFGAGKEAYEGRIDPEFIDVPKADQKTKSNYKSGGAEKKPTISEPRVKRMFAIAKAAGWTTADMKDALKCKFGLDSMKDILVEEYDEIVDFYGQPPSPKDDGDDIPL